MAKLNEELKAVLTFKTKESMDSAFPGHKQIIVSTEHKGIYRQYSFHVGDSANNPLHVDRLVEEAKNILTWSIDDAIKKQQHETK